MDCLFCKIANQTIATNLLYRDEYVVAFEDIAPQAPKHFLIIPHQHIPSLAEANVESIELLGRMLLTGKHLAKEHGIAEQGYRSVINCRVWGGQTIDHLHLHILGGRAMTWPPG